MESMVLDFINLCRLTFGRYPNHSGGCYKFHKLLNKVFGGDGYYNGDHVITKIDGKFYDIDGQVLKENNYYRIGCRVYSEEFMEKIFAEYL